ncbi:universal stress protein [Oceanidesulfovibrio indonesiensis]|uniref:Universal stress protein n=1 Tax=Oceanidesulfovibrio indonesiensis TaxID=54767 RepID=A0A7M3MG55_9BACT|nr:universal stress protein [Oceanidesulfovibrio indonesiensis]TVM18303.1 universal stress protein [Oceanidesulfovibrio indonesiensis]
MSKKILLATTGSPASFGAARVAFQMAKRYGSEIIVFHVIGLPTKAYSQIVHDVRTGDEVQVDDDYKSWVEDELRNTYARQIEEAEGGVSFVLTTGVPHREILRTARSEDVDLIIMGASSGSIDHIDYKGYTGSTLQKVAKAAKCPVMTVHRESAAYRGGFNHVLFCTDFSKQANHAFKYALNTARECDCDMTMFHALDVGGKVLAQNEIEDRLIEARKRMRSLYGSQMGDFKNYDVEAWEGIPYMEIVKLARERMADLIVMAHHAGESDSDEARLGSTLEQVILRASCPVVSVNKPDKV